MYYFDRTDSIWMNCTNDLPPTAYKYIKFSHPRAKILVGTQAKGIWEADLPCYDDSVTTTITINTTWNFSNHMLGDLVIDSGAILTVKKNVFMPTTAKVIVKRGGKLLVDGGRFTNACDNLWFGIELHGTDTALQTPTAQGWIEITNGGMIENSKYGIYTGKLNSSGEGYVSGYKGGVIQCDSAFFLNNMIAVQFLGYTQSSASWFVNTTFETNDDYMGISDPDYFVDINLMTGVDFTHCTFVNNSTTIDDQNGVEIYNSSTNFEGECTAGTPCTAWNEGLFKNLNYGIYDYSSTTSKLLDVRHTKFEDNFRGLYLSGSDACRITSNSFEIDTGFVTNGGCGLYLNECSGYWVEENSFEHIGDTAVGIGIVVNNSEGDANEIYRNTFYNLEQGISAQEQNKNGRIGLQILCNDFDTCNADIYVPLPSVSGRGISPYQGVAGSDDPEDMAGNIFYYEEYTTDYDDINNLGDGINYYYDLNNDINVKPEDEYGTTLQGKDTDPDWTFANGCPSKISSGGGTKSTGENFKELFSYFNNQAESLKNTLNEIIDGGDTEGLKTEVILSTPPETYQIYTDLIEKSPYLSETVIGLSIEKENVLPNAMVRDVLVANPHSANSNQLIEKLDERQVPIPDYMKAQILQGNSLTTLKHELESQLANNKLKRNRALNGLIKHYIYEIPDPQYSSDSILLLYQLINDLHFKYQLAMHHLYREESNEGEIVLDNIIIQYNLNENEQAAHENFENFFGLVKSIKEDGREETELTQSEIHQLESIMQSGTGIASVYARNILLAMDQIDYLAPIQKLDLLKSKEAEENYNEILNTKPPKNLNVFPNPSSYFVIVEYHIEKENDGIIEIYDINGILIKTIELTRLQDQVTIKTQNWVTGTYTFVLKNNKKLIESVKFTLVK